MGMTGRISNQEYIPSLESLSEKDSYPPPHTHMILKIESPRNNRSHYEVAFSDPRRFGAVSFGRGSSLHQQWEDFAMDAMHPQATLSALVGYSKGVKATLLNQRAIVSGVGNWIADEVLYQSKIHPDQSFLTQEEVDQLERALKFVLQKGNECLVEGRGFPSDWIFHVRWKKSSKDAKTKALTDWKGRGVTFLKSGGRTSAIVASIQKRKNRGCQVAKERNAIPHGKDKPSSKRIKRIIVPSNHSVTGEEVKRRRSKRIIHQTNGQS